MNSDQPQLTHLFGDIIASTLPSTIVTFGNQARAAATAAKQVAEGRCGHAHLEGTSISPEQVPALASGLALLSAPIDQLTPEDSIQLIGTLRNLGTRHIVVAIGEGSLLSFQDFIALGFRRHVVDETDNGALTLYTYNLDTYNHKRAWNNPQYWANPEMWGKAWW